MRPVLVMMFALAAPAAGIVLGPPARSLRTPAPTAAAAAGAVAAPSTLTPSPGLPSLLLPPPAGGGTSFLFASGSSSYPSSPV